MNIVLSALLSAILLFNSHVSYCQNQIPFLQKKGDAVQLIVEGRPFIICGGELGNSSASMLQSLKPIWPKLKAMNLNTILLPVSWELIERKEGAFDFSLVKQYLSEARENNMKVILLWFGSWKNSMSCYTPAWIKLNQEKYPRVIDAQNRSCEILTPFSDTNLIADLHAFQKLMNFVREFDRKHQTVIMVQVENEIGLLPSARDYCTLANEFFQKEVPAELTAYLQAKRTMLVPEFLQIWEKNGCKTSGNWEEVFGKGLQTDEIFMAWYFSKYTNRIIDAGKKTYPLPMFVNAALNRPEKDPGSGYPSAGPLPHIMDVWKAGGPSIDFFAPDIYFTDFKHWCDLYTRQGNPLFIPEHRLDNTITQKSIYAIGHYNALGFSPFAIESIGKQDDEPLGKMYRIISQLTPTIAARQGQGKIEGVLFDKMNQEAVIRLGNYELLFRHEYSLGWSPGAHAEEWPMASAIIIQTAEEEFYIAGTGVVVTCKRCDTDVPTAGILKVEEGMFENNQWKILKHLNGDQTHQGRHVHIPCGEYSIQRLTLYTYK